MSFVILIIALIGLWLGSQLIIKGALNIARRFELSEFFVGLTILAVGTDLPELFIVIKAAFEKLSGIDTSGLIVGETIGTTFSQITLIMGITGLLGTLIITKRGILRDGLTMLGAIIAVFILGFDGELSKTDGLIMMAGYLFYFITIVREERLRDREGRAPSMDPFWAIVSLIGGFALLLYSSDLTIDQSIAISRQLGISQSFIGILLVGLGTSLPELATAVTAVRKKAGSLAVGNLLGSNIFDILFALGIGSAISGFHFAKDLLWFDMIFLFAACALAFILLVTRKRIYRKEAFVLIGVYLIYIASKVALGISEVAAI